MAARFALNLADQFDYLLCKIGLTRPASFEQVLDREYRALYAGRLSRYLPQYRTHVGLTPFFPSSNNIGFDVTQPIPLPDNSIDLYQAEDVFEHIDYGCLATIIDEIYRVLKPGSLFRLSVPDYGFPPYRERSLKDANGNILFDPGGGGCLRNGRVERGGHVWFPTHASVEDLFRRTKFHIAGEVTFLHYNAADGTRVMNAIDYSLGYIQRVPGHDPRVAADPRPISIVVDAIKGEEAATLQSDETLKGK